MKFQPDTGKFPRSLRVLRICMMKKFFALYVLAIVAIAAGITSAEASRINHWSFEEGAPGGGVATGAGSITDIIGGINGDPSGSPVYVGGAISGYGSTGLRFDGVNDTVRVISGSPLPDALGSTAPLALVGDFTIEMGVNVDASGNGGFGVFYGGTDGGKDPYYLALNSNGSITFQLYGGTGGVNFLTTAAGVYEFGAATQIAAIFDFDDVNGTDNMMEIYVQQMLVASLNVGTNQPFYNDDQHDLHIGSVDGVNAFFKGTMTDVIFHDTAISTSEMLQVPEPGMVAIFGIGIFALGLALRKRA